MSSVPSFLLSYLLCCTLTCWSCNWYIKMIEFQLSQLYYVSHCGLFLRRICNEPYSKLKAIISPKALAFVLDFRKSGNWWSEIVSIFSGTWKSCTHFSFALWFTEFGGFLFFMQILRYDLNGVNKCRLTLLLVKHG